MERGRGGFERWRRRGRVWGTIEIGGGAFSGCGRRGFGFEDLVDFVLGYFLKLNL